MPMRDPYDRRPEPLVIVVSGPSGVGKDAVVRGLESSGYSFYFVVNATSRPRRDYEVHGRDYFFVSEEEFERMIEQGELLEHALVYGDYKGIPKAQIREALQSGKDVILRIDVQGAATIHRLIPDAVFVFLIAASDDELVERLRRRSTEPPEGLACRIEMARREMEEIDKFDYVIVNREAALDEAVSQLLSIIRAEKCRVSQRKLSL